MSKPSSKLINKSDDDSVFFFETMIPDGTDITKPLTSKEEHCLLSRVNVLQPPDVMYHGTCVQLIPTIRRRGLFSRVHMSPDIEVARTAGSQLGDPAVVKIDVKQMKADGFTFICLPTGVWRTKRVPKKYIGML